VCRAMDISRLTIIVVKDSIVCVLTRVKKISHLTCGEARQDRAIIIMKNRDGQKMHDF
jgi:hypothetical protein